LEGRHGRLEADFGIVPPTAFVTSFAVAAGYSNVVPPLTNPGRGSVGWAEAFFNRNRDAVCAIFDESGEDWRWLALVRSGERPVDDAWAARANTVTEAGWAGFRDGLQRVRLDLAAARRLAPDRPPAPARMIAMAMDQSQPRDMRMWFQRALDAQIDHRQAWASMRWTLRPRWHGSHEAMLALGVAAVDTGRFDTDAPRQLIEVILDLENDLGVEDRRLLGRDDIWPHVGRMYDGYLVDPSRSIHRDGWRAACASAAYLAGKYEVARTQLARIFRACTSRCRAHGRPRKTGDGRPGRYGWPAIVSRRANAIGRSLPGPAPATRLPPNGRSFASNPSEPPSFRA